MIEIIVICAVLYLCPLFVGFMKCLDAKYYSSELAKKDEFKKVYKRAKLRYRFIKDKSISFNDFLQLELKKYYEWEDCYFEWLEK